MTNNECKLCVYFTKDKSNYIKHLRSKKHLEKVSMNNKIKNKNTDNSFVLFEDSHTTATPPPHHIAKSYTCRYCESNFSRLDSLNRHKKTCDGEKREIERLQLLIKQYEKEKKDQEKVFKIKLSQSEKESKHFEEESKYYKQMLKEAGSLVKKSVSSLTYIVEHYDSAPAIRMIKRDDIKNLDGYNIVAEDILSYYKHRTLSKFLGDIIVKLYKTDDPQSQSIWNTDTSRLTYLIKEFMENKSSNWIVDKKGTKTTEYIIVPILDYLKEILIEYQKSSNIISMNNVEMEMMLENSRAMIDLINDIDDGNLAKEVLRYISVHLKFDNKLLKE